MMRTLCTFLGTTMLLAGLTGCISTDPNDILTSGFTASASATATATDTDPGTETVGDGDGDATGDGDGDGDGDATGDGDGDGDGPTGCFNCPCGPAGECDDGLSCNPDTMTCELGGGDGDGDDPTTTGGGADGSWDPNMCAPPGMPIGVQDIEGGFCSYTCTQGNEAADCPPTPPGVVPGAACALEDGMGNTLCALLCTIADPVCPDGATCQDLGQQGLGVCTWP